jgi:hypothetical protein
MDPLCMSLIMPAYVLCFDKLVADVFCCILFSWTPFIQHARLFARCWEQTSQPTHEIFRITIINLLVLPFFPRFFFQLANPNCYSWILLGCDCKWSTLYRIPWNFKWSTLPTISWKCISRVCQLGEFTNLWICLKEVILSAQKDHHWVEIHGLRNVHLNFGNKA